MLIVGDTMESNSHPHSSHIGVDTLYWLPFRIWAQGGQRGGLGLPFTCTLCPGLAALQPSPCRQRSLHTPKPAPGGLYLCAANRPTPTHSQGGPGTWTCCLWHEPPPCLTLFTLEWASPSGEHRCQLRAEAPSATTPCAQAWTGRRNVEPLACWQQAEPSLWLPPWVSKGR